MNEIKRDLNRIANALEELVKILSKNNNFSSTHTPIIQKEQIINNISVSSKESLQIIEKFLNDKGIKIKTYKHLPNTPYDKITLFIGNRFEHVKDFMQLLKKSIQLKNGEVSLNLKSFPQEKISSITQLCTNLFNLALLEDYKYKKSPHFTLKAKINLIPQVINYINGGWYEDFIKLSIIEILNKFNLKFHFLQNIQISLPNKDDFELDLIFEINNNFFWFEAKTGDYQRYINKYSKISEILNLPSQHSFMCLLEMTNEGEKALSDLFNMNVCSIYSFKEKFEKILKEVTF